jgi:hypothetical protein
MSICDDRHQVVVHVDTAVLQDRGRGPVAEGRCELAGGPWLAAESARRLACDAAVVRLVEGPDGAPLDVGRKTCSIPPAIRRALIARNAGCRFPGCTHTRFVDAHHVHHSATAPCVALIPASLQSWADGGETRLGNLVMLCRHHHRLVHESGFEVRMLDDGALRFSRPDGRAVRAQRDVPAGTSGSVQRLRAANHRAGLDIDADTVVTLWDGLAMDLAMAVEGLMQRDGGL